MIHVVIEREAISANSPIYGANKRGQRWKYKKLRENLINDIENLLGPGEEEERKAFRITRHWGPRKRQFDEANLVGGFKILVDAMVKTGHIADDNPNLFKCYYFQKKSTTGFGYIEIEEIDPYGELLSLFQKGAENLEVEKEPLLKAAIESKLLKPS